MAQRAIEGKNVLLRGLSGGEYLPFACATSVEFYYDTELIEKATVGMAGFRSYVSGFGEWGLTLDTVTHVLPTDAQLTVFDTLLESLRKTGLDIELIFEDGDGNIKTITGHAMIPHTSITSPVDGFSEDNIEMKGSGQFQINTDLQTPISTDTDLKDPIDFTSVSGGETSLTYAALIGRTIVYFGRDGVDSEVIEAGTPNAKQVKFITASGQVAFPTDMPLREGEWVHILYK